MHVDRRLLIETTQAHRGLGVCVRGGLAGDRRCRTERLRSVAGGQRSRLAGSELGVQGDDAIRQEVADPALRPASDDEARDQMEVGPRVDIVLDAGRDDRQDGGGALATDVEPGE